MAKAHLWRQYPDEPYDRFAFTVEYDPTTEDSYRMIDYDPTVADPDFLHDFAEHMSKSAPGGANEEEDGKIYEFINWHRPGTVEHFETAVRQFPQARLCGKGRP